MGARGPRKTPDELARLRGYPGKQKKSEPVKPEVPAAGALQPPKWLDTFAREEWRRLEPELNRLGLLTKLDVGKFAAYCAWFSRWRQAETKLNSLKGKTVVVSGNQQYSHPIVQQARSAAEMMNRFASYFGLSPSDRSSMAIPLDPTAPKHDTPGNRPAVPRDEFELFQQRRQRGGRERP
jgi:P27 family predicted phage terminase small subunit